MEIQVNSDDLKFESISDFNFALINGGEIEFEWNGISYGAFREGENEDIFCVRLIKMTMEFSLKLSMNFLTMLLTADPYENL